MNFIILGDKFQKRMKSKGCVGLIKINNKPLIEHQYSIIKESFPNAKIIYIHGFESKKFLSFIYKNNKIFKDLITIYNPNYDKYNHAYSLSLAKDYLIKDSYILFGDSVLHKKTFVGARDSQVSHVFINKKYKNKLGCIVNNSKITNIAYDLDNYLSDIYYISRTQSGVLTQILNPVNYNCFIFELINIMIDMNQTIKPLFIDCPTKPLVIYK